MVLGGVAPLQERRMREAPVEAIKLLHSQSIARLRVKLRAL